MRLSAHETDFPPLPAGPTAGLVRPPIRLGPVWPVGAVGAVGVVGPV